MSSKITMALLVGAIVLLSPVVWGQQTTLPPAGASELRFLELLITGNYGLALGLGVAIFGVWQISQNNTSFGVVLLIVSACLTFAPGILNGTREFVCPVTRALGNNIKC